MDFMGIASVAAITVIAWLVGEAVKLSPLDNKWIPVICGVVGGILGIVGMYTMQDFKADDVMTAAAVGIVSGLAATGIDQIGKQFSQAEQQDEHGKHEKKDE
ncbi:MAG: phage holin family protein [Oscillospiraceae bacterium]|nr:phage holin family protein [Oscillospiraceae bacterium]